MITKDHDLPIKRQAELLNISRSSVYYRPRPVRADTLALMRRIDELHLELPFAGSRMLRDLLRLEGTRAGRHRMRRLMRIMGIEAIYRKKNTSTRCIRIFSETSSLIVPTRSGPLTLRSCPWPEALCTWWR